MATATWTAPPSGSADDPEATDIAGRSRGGRCEHGGRDAGLRGITLDLDGHRIQGSGPDTAAVRVVGAEDTKVVDGRIRGFAHAVFVDAADDLTVRGLDIRGADDESIALLAVNDAAIARNVIRGSEEGYHVEASGGSSLVRVKANAMAGGGIDFGGASNRLTAAGNAIQTRRRRASSSATPPRSRSRATRYRDPPCRGLR